MPVSASSYVRSAKRDSAASSKTETVGNDQSENCRRLGYGAACMRALLSKHMDMQLPPLHFRPGPRIKTKARGDSVKCPRSM